RVAVFNRQLLLLQGVFRNGIGLLCGDVREVALQHSGVCKSRLPAGSGVQASCVCVLIKGHSGNIILRCRFIPGALVNAGNFLRVCLQTCQI
ncbi:Mor transcription activator domain-containing protein, partial [Dysosmobacter welbionis]